LGQPSEGLAQIRHGVQLYQGLTTPPIFWQLLLLLQAGAHAQAGKPAGGLVLIDEALQIANRGPGTLLPEFCLLKGDLLLALPQTNAADAEPWFQRAFDIAQDLGERMPQLRASVRLCRIRQNTDQAAEAARTLGAVYDTFTEGFTTADLNEAADLLQSLHSG
jgi:hypothetical protein